MSQSGPNPVLAPIRRWVLYSRTNLVIAVVGVAAVLFAIGAVVGQDRQPRAAANTADATGISTEPAAAADTISYDLDEVSESLVVAKTATWAASSAPATAMAYAHAFVDTTLPDAKWVRAIGRYTAAEPGDTTVAARPRTPVVILGPTISTLVDGPGGTQRARVTVPTQAGNMQIPVVVEELADGKKRWVVGTPLPTLDLTQVSAVAPPGATATTTAVPSLSTESPAAEDETATPRPSSPPTPAAAPESTYDLDGPTSEPSGGDDPTPVPGPIPIPDLDTPIPGQR
ncbi:hypothetical protein ACFWDA_23340 [Rhodococcus zopfii]|uniref:hypothetical protein n=1 Tax=Rhodococcus zopfii TaxID=43772 RepID=UPI00365CCDC6